MEYVTDVAKELEQVVAQLKNKHIRMPPQRRAILSYMIQTHNHPTVEEIYHDLLPDWPSLSLATIYNNLSFLVKEGYVNEMKFSDVTSRYDYMGLNGYNHQHIICERCGKIADFAMTKFPDPTEDVHKQTGFTTNRTKVEVYGVCPDCQGRIRAW